VVRGNRLMGLTDKGIINPTFGYRETLDVEDFMNITLPLEVWLSII